MKREEMQDSFLSISEHKKKLCRTVTLKKNDTLLRKGEPITNVYVVLTGIFSIEEPAYTGDVYSFTKIESNGLLGELEVLMNERLSHFTVRAAAVSVLLEIPRDVFMEWLETDIQFCNYVLHHLAVKTMANAQTISDYPFSSGLKKVVNFLLIFCEEETSSGNRYPLVVDYTRVAISEKLGISVRTINRAVSNLRSQGLIGVAKKKITVEEIQYKRLLAFKETI